MNKLIIIPFDGFYESVTDGYLDDVIESEKNYIEDELGLELPANFYNYRVKSFDAIARRYVLEYASWLKKEHGLTLDSLKFESLQSPKEYNFTTDRIFCELSIDDIEKLYAFALANDLLTQNVIDDTFKSRSGFFSSYDDFCIEWRTKPVLDWDHNELAVLLPDPQAHQYNYWGLWEDADSNGFFYDCIQWAHNIDEVIYGN